MFFIEKDILPYVESFCLVQRILIAADTLRQVRNILVTKFGFVGMTYESQTKQVRNSNYRKYPG